MQTSRPDYHLQLPDIFGVNLAALAVAGLVGDEPEPVSLVAWVDLSGADGRDLAVFRFALEMEHTYADAYMGFSEKEFEPHYEAAWPLNLAALAYLFEVDRVLCVIAMTDCGDVIGARDYGNIDLVHVNGVCGEIRRLASLLAERDPPGRGGALN
jgi:hypothetical protein